MLIIRPAHSADLNHIMDMVGRSGFGLTNLPKDRDLIAKRLVRSMETFSMENLPPKGASYLFVMEDRDSSRVVGTSGIISSVGIGEPFYAYQIRTQIHESPSLGVKKEIECLHLSTMREGPCEIGGLFVHPDYQKHGSGRLVSLSRFLFFADHHERFPSNVLAEMRGIIDDKGRCPFWEALGRPFFEMDFPRADYLSAIDKGFIAELLPTYPICIPLLPESARMAIGAVHDRTQPALKMLKEEGFQETGMIDIFDGGPIIQSAVKAVRTVKESKVGLLTGMEESGPDDVPWLLGTGRLNRFRSCVAPHIGEEPQGLRLPPAVVEALGIELGARVRYVPLKPRRRT